MYGQLGLGDCLDRYEPCLVQHHRGKGEDVTPLEVTMAACGDQHTLLLDTRGQVWAAGANWRGQIGVGIGPVVVDSSGHHALDEEAGGVSSAMRRWSRNVSNKLAQNAATAAWVTPGSRRRIIGSSLDMKRLVSVAAATSSAVPCIQTAIFMRVPQLHGLKVCVFVRLRLSLSLCVCLAGTSSHCVPCARLCKCALAATLRLP